jgi:hypothetical protein
MTTPNIAAVVHVLTHRDEYAKPAAELSLTEKTEAYAALHFIEEVSTSRREALRENLLVCADKGSLTEKGGRRLEVGDHLILKEKRVATAPDEKKLLALIESKKIAMTSAFDKISVHVPSPSKIAALVETGHLTKEEAADLYKVTWALVVKPSGELEGLLESSIPASVVPVKKTRR